MIFYFLICESFLDLQVRFHYHRKISLENIMKIKIKRVLISVSDKKGIVEFAKELNALGIEIISTGGTFKLLQENGIDAKKVAEVTGFPEILSGRVKTLHPVIHGGILARRDNDSDLQEIKEHNIQSLDMVVVNLYPFAKVISKDSITVEEAIENIDIGGPTMLRSAAKNFKYVVPIIDPNDYQAICDELKNNDSTVTINTSKKLAQKVFQVISKYDYEIQNYFSKSIVKEEKKFPDTIMLNLKKNFDLRYGENSHQSAAFYVENNIKETSVAGAKQLHGKQLSFNNIIDIEAALEIVRDFSEPTISVIKHTNPCGVARNDSLTEAFIKAKGCDPTSAFGGIVGANREIDEETAAEISKTFFEAVIAPSFSKKALDILTKKKNIRLLETGEFTPKYPSYDFKKVVEGLLVQDRDIEYSEQTSWKIVTEKKPDADDLKGLMFAFKIAKWIKSNAIVFTTKDYTVGIGAGQMSRVDSTELAIKKAQYPIKGAYLGSDAFIPFKDNIDVAAKVGVKAIIQPGGSVRDAEVIEACNEHNTIMVFSGQRHFRH